MKNIILLSLIVPLFISCNGQNPSISNNGSKKIIGGGCDGCELMYIGMPLNILGVDTSDAWNEDGQKLLIKGTVYQIDGTTPANDILIYYWQTNAGGVYPSKTTLDKRVQQHGYIRGWVKTNSLGNYSIYTIRPGSYPNEQMPAHIHLSIKEPSLANEYYTDEINFEDDPYLSNHFKKYPQENRGGSGVVKIKQQGSLQIGEHDIILGLNIPNYPKKSRR